MSCSYTVDHSGVHIRTIVTGAAQRRPLEAAMASGGRRGHPKWLGNCRTLMPRCEACRHLRGVRLLPLRAPSIGLLGIRALGEVPLAAKISVCCNHVQSQKQQKLCSCDRPMAASNLEALPARSVDASEFEETVGGPYSRVNFSVLVVVSLGNFAAIWTLHPRPQIPPNSVKAYCHHTGALQTPLTPRPKSNDSSALHEEHAHGTKSRARFVTSDEERNTSFFCDGNHDPRASPGRNRTATLTHKERYT